MPYIAQDVILLATLCNQLLWKAATTSDVERKKVILDYLSLIWIHKFISAVCGYAHVNLETPPYHQYIRELKQHISCNRVANALHLVDKVIGECGLEVGD